MEIADEVLTSSGFGHDGPEAARARVAAVLVRTWKPSSRVDRVSREIVVALGDILRDVQDSRVPPTAMPDLQLAELARRVDLDYGAKNCDALETCDCSAAQLHRFLSANDGERCPQCQVLGVHPCVHPASLGPAGIAAGTEPCG